MLRSASEDNQKNKVDLIYLKKLGLIDELADNHFAPFERIIKEIETVSTAYNDIQILINQLNGKVDLLKVIVEDSTINSMVINSEFIVAYNEFLTLKKKMAQRTEEKTDVLPSLILDHLPDKLIAVEEILFQDKPSRDANEATRNLFLVTQQLILSRAKQVTHFSELHKKLEINLPEQKKAFDRIKSELINIKAALKKRLDDDALKAKQQENKIAISPDPISPPLVSPSRDEAKDTGPAVQLRDNGSRHMTSPNLFYHQQAAPRDLVRERQPIGPLSIHVPKTSSPTLVAKVAENESPTPLQRDSSDSASKQRVSPIAISSTHVGFHKPKAKNYVAPLEIKPVQIAWEDTPRDKPVSGCGPCTIM